MITKIFFACYYCSFHSCMSRLRITKIFGSLTKVYSYLSGLSSLMVLCTVSKRKHLKMPTHLLKKWDCWYFLKYLVLLVKTYHLRLFRHCLTYILDITIINGYDLTTSVRVWREKKRFLVEGTQIYNRHTQSFGGAL